MCSKSVFDTRPRHGHIRIASGGNVRTGIYLSKNLYSSNNSVLLTTDSYEDALQVRLSPASNPGVIECLVSSLGNLHDDSDTKDDVRTQRVMGSSSSLITPRGQTPREFVLWYKASKQRGGPCKALGTRAKWRVG